MVNLKIHIRDYIKQEKKGLVNESSLGYVITGGNSESETVSFKQNSSYGWEKDIERKIFLEKSGEGITALQSIWPGV